MGMVKLNEVFCGPVCSLLKNFGSSYNVCVFLHTIKQFSDTSSGCPIIQLDSDSIDPDIASGSTGQGLSTPRLPAFRHQSQVQVVTCASDQLAVNQRFPQPPPWIQLICYRGSQNSGNPLIH